MRVPEVCAGIARPLVAECVALLNGTLCDERDTIVVLRSTLPDAMPVDGHLHALHVVLHVDDNLVVLAHLDTRSGNHPICRENSTFNAIGQNALTVTPHSIRRIGCAHLAGTVSSYIVMMM